MNVGRLEFSLKLNDQVFVEICGRSPPPLKAFHYVSKHSSDVQKFLIKNVITSRLPTALILYIVLLLRDFLIDFTIANNAV